MQVQANPIPTNERVVAGLPFVQALARRLAASMPHSIDLGDLVQDGVLGLIDAAQRFDDARGIKFETFAERRVRGAMIDALRREAWPRGVRRQRRELEAARETLRGELGQEPTLAELAAKVGSAARSSASARSNRPRRCRRATTSTSGRCRPPWCRPSPSRPTRPTSAPR
jgi:RNA polymerase sigma factor (sigma-70 family)